VRNCPNPLGIVHVQVHVYVHDYDYDYDYDYDQVHVTFSRILEMDQSQPDSV
jgi:hypothetical protein